MNRLSATLYTAAYLLVPLACSAEDAIFDKLEDGLSLAIPPSYDKVLAYGPVGRERIGRVLPFEERESGHNFEHCDTTRTTVNLDELRITTEECSEGSPIPGSWATLGLREGDKIDFFLSPDRPAIAAYVAATQEDGGFVVRFEEPAVDQLKEALGPFSASYLGPSTRFPDGTNLFVPAGDGAAALFPVPTTEGGDIGLFWISPGTDIVETPDLPDDRG